MDDRRFLEILALQREQQGVEFKRAGPRSDRHLFAKVTRAVLSMANRRDGGVVIVGVSDESQVLSYTGVQPADLPTWSYDAVADGFAACADPGVDFELEIREHEEKSYVVLEVEEFADSPVLCKRDYPDVLRDGACYVRSRRKPESVEVPRHVEMRDLLEIAIDKGIAAFLRRTRQLGIDAGEAFRDDSDHFDDQLGDLP